MKSVSIFSSVCEKCFTFFLQMRTVLRFFKQNARKYSFFRQKKPKSISIFPAICETCLNFLTKLEKCFNFFDKKRKMYHVFPTK